MRRAPHTQAPTPAEDVHTRNFLLSLIRAMPVLASIWDPSVDYCFWESVYYTPSFGTSVNLFDFNLSGALPELEAGINASLVQVSVFSVNGRRGIHGTLPLSRGSLTVLESLKVTCCGITGTLPPEWAGLPSLRLNSTKLAGTIPVAWRNMTSLIRVSVEGTQITGCAPMEWLCHQHLSSAAIGLIPTALDLLPNSRRLPFERKARVAAVAEITVSGIVCSLWWVIRHRGRHVVRYKGVPLEPPVTIDTDVGLLHRRTKMKGEPVLYASVPRNDATTAAAGVMRGGV